MRSYEEVERDGELDAVAIEEPLEGPRDPLWYKRAVFYEVLIRGFADSNNDGTGDIRGLTGKLDYLKWLGIDCLWVPPFFTSPLRDGGYDVADYTSILPECGTVDDFREFVAAAQDQSARRDHAVDALLARQPRIFLDAIDRHFGGAAEHRKHRSVF